MTKIKIYKGAKRFLKLFLVNSWTITQLTQLELAQKKDKDSGIKGHHPACHVSLLALNM